MGVDVIFVVRIRIAFATIAKALVQNKHRAVIGSEIDGWAIVFKLDQTTEFD